MTERTIWLATAAVDRLVGPHNHHSVMSTPRAGG